MSGNPRRKSESLGPRAAKTRAPKPDARVQRTRSQLGQALITLILEKSIRDVTVQDVLDRSGVGRSTFYLHFRDKDDLLISQLEMFLEVMSNSLSMQGEKSERVVPVAEMFAHIGNQNKLYRVLSDSGHLKDFFELAEGYFARGIERRLAESGRLTHIAPRELAARSAAFSGSLLSLLRWWLDRGEKESPEQMDKTFHQLVWSGLR
jgi:AcrR family transcriptional regulator